MLAYLSGEEVLLPKGTTIAYATPIRDVELLFRSSLKPSAPAA
jgi:hypothetical protein